MRWLKIFGEWSVQASKQAGKNTQARVQWSHTCVGLAQARPYQGLNHLNTSKMFNSARTTVYYTLIVCYQAQGKRNKANKKRREGN